MRESEGRLLVLNGARGEKFPLDGLVFQSAVAGGWNFEDGEPQPTVFTCLNGPVKRANPRARPDGG